VNTENSNKNNLESRNATKELSRIIKHLYESFEMLSRWTPEFSAKEFLLILALRGMKPHRVSDLAQKTGFSISTVSWLADSLVKKKIVTRRRATNDRRVVMVKLAPKGLDALNEYDRIFDEIADMFYGVLTPQEQKEFLRLNKKVIKKLEEKVRTNSKPYGQTITTNYFLWKGEYTDE